MRGVFSLLLLISLLSTSARAQYHRAVYLTGGNYLGGPSATFTEGLIRIDLTTAPVARTLFLPGSLSHSFMDADNESRARGFASSPLRGHDSLACIPSS